MQTRRDVLAATRAEILARLIHGEPADEADRRRMNRSSAWRRRWEAKGGVRSCGCTTF